MTRLEDLYNSTFSYAQDYRGGNYPYKNYTLLQLLVALHRPRRILEAGTALGLSSIAMAEGWAEARVSTMDKDTRAVAMARQNIQAAGLINRIELLEGEFLELLSGMQEQYDMVFFDGFAPGLTVFLEMERLLKVGGLLVYANLTLGGDRRKIMDRLHNHQHYSHCVQIEDTAMAIKMG